MGTPDEGMKDEGGKVERDRGVDLCLSVEFGTDWKLCEVVPLRRRLLRICDSIDCCLKVKLWWLGACRG